MKIRNISIQILLYVLVVWCGSRTYDIPVTSRDALPLSYRRLIEARPLNIVHVTIHHHVSCFYGFCSMKPLGVLLLPLEEMLFHCRATLGKHHGQTQKPTSHPVVSTLKICISSKRLRSEARKKALLEIQ